VTLYIIIEILLIFVGLIYVYVAGSCAPGSPCPNVSEVWLKGFVFPTIFAILAPIAYFLIWKRKKE